MRVRVKICGITRVEDAEAAALAGADALGLVFHGPSPRAVTPAAARELCRGIAPFVSTVALFVDPSADQVREVLDVVRPDLLQFHGSEDAAFCASFGVPYLKALHVGGPQALRERTAAYASARGLLLDTWDPSRAGGTGRSFDWSAVEGARGYRLILAGGLHAGNVADAIRTVRPWAVDTSTGVESAPGIKNARRIGEFMDAVRHAERAWREATGEQQ